jgi:hypothetical protein
MTTTTKLDDNRRLVIDENGWKASRIKLNEAFVRAMDKLRNWRGEESTACTMAAIEEPGFVADGIDPTTEAKLMEIDRQYKKAVLQIVEAFYEAQSQQMDTFIQRLPVLLVRSATPTLPA